MRLESFRLDMFEDVVNMFFDFYKEIYPNRAIGDKYFFYKEVTRWINEKHDIIVCTDNEKPVGFSLSYIDDMGGLTEPIYQGDIAYVIPARRKTRAAFMLYNNVVKYAEQIKLKLRSFGRISNGVSDMIQKHFKAEAKYIIFEKE